MRDHFPDARLLVVKNGADLFLSVANGLAVGISSNFPSAYGVIDKMGLNSFFMPQALPLFARNLHPAVLRDRDDIAQLLDAGLAHISRAEMVALEERWIRNPAHRVWGNMQLRAGTADCGEAALAELVRAAEDGDPYDLVLMKPS